MMKPSVIAVLVACVFTAGCTSYFEKRAVRLGYEKPDDYSAWPPKATATPGTAKALIDDDFRQHADACGIKMLADRSYVSREVTTELGPKGDMVGEVVDVAGGSIVWYVYEDTEIASPLSAVSTSRLLLPTYTTADNLLQAHTSYSGWTLMRSCAGYVAGSVTAGGAIPAAAARASIAADANRKSTLAVVSGRFVSPLTDVLARGDWRARHALLQLWDMYVARPTLVGKAHYMREFDGIMLRRARNISMNVDVGASGDLTLTGVNARLRAGQKIGDVFDATNWRTIVFSDTATPTVRRDRFERLPEPAEIGTRVRRAAVPVKSTDVLRKGAPYTLAVEVEGVPQGVCNRTWTIAPSTNVFQEVPKVSQSHSFRRVDDIAVPVCQFNISGVPRDDVFGAAPLPVVVPFRGTITYEKPVGSAKLELDIYENLTTTNHPIPLFRTAEPVPVATVNTATGKFKVAWEPLVGFDDSLEPVKSDPGTKAVITPIVDVTCGGKAIQITADARAEADGNFHIYLRSAADLSHAEYDVGTTTSECTFVNAMTVTLVKSPVGRTVTVPLKLRLQFPVTKTPAPQGMPQ